MEEKGQGAAPEQTLNFDENFALTGYFNDGRKRIDLVLVFEDDGSDDIKEIRINFLMNAIQFGLEAEIEPGKMFRHRHLIFVKLHASDEIIEECGLYLNEKSLFKDSHLEFINPIFNIFGVRTERELIKIVRKQYPGPDNYSTLERSNIVYKILLELPFGKYKNHFGINKLIKNGIIRDAFALHDGPYFIVPKQDRAHINARQVLFLEWLGMINVWKTQPIHMIHEYFGKRISYYFAFYEYFNFMLIIPSVVGFFVPIFLYIDADNKDNYKVHFAPCGGGAHPRYFIYPECRNFTLCPVLREKAYCEEIKYLATIDKKTTFGFGAFIVIWGFFFLISWRYREKYLNWIWEGSKRYTNRLVRTEYKELKMVTKTEKTAKRITQTKNPGRLLKMFIYIITAGCLCLWIFLMFRFSMLIWHYPRWKRVYGPRKSFVFKYNENENLAIGAGLYTCIAFVIKMVLMILTQKITDCENNKTFLTYESSLALKMYAFSFVGSFMILITYTYLGAVFKHIAHFTPFKAYHFMYGYGMMNSGLGSTFDDISITLGVITILEHLIFKMPGFLIKDNTDYPVGFESRTPCWEREYRLKPLTEFFFHKRYNALATQFALLTCYSMMFPMASLLLFIINIWDLRHAARQLLLEYRRPLLINTSGPGFWKYLILITAFYAPMSNTAILVYQSRTFESTYFKLLGFKSRYTTTYYFDKTLEVITKQVKDTKKDYDKMTKWIRQNYYLPNYCTVNRYWSDLVRVMRLEIEIRFLFLITCIGAVLGFFLFYVIPGTTNSLEDAIKKEQQIKNKYQIQRVK